MRDPFLFGTSRSPFPGLSVPVVFAETITVGTDPTTAGLVDLVAGVTAAEVLAAWTGQPVASVTGGGAVSYQHSVLLDGVAQTGVIGGGSLTIVSIITADGARAVARETPAVTVAGGDVFDVVGGVGLLTINAMPDVTAPTVTGGVNSIQITG